jgi:hypothetical protein
MSTYKESTGKSIDESFAEYHAKHPDVYEYFKRFALQWITTGATRISSKQIIGRIRWHVQVESLQEQQKPEDFKINDAFTSRYARLFAGEFPQHKDKLEQRALRTKGYAQLRVPEVAVTIS